MSIIKTFVSKIQKEELSTEAKCQRKFQKQLEMIVNHQSTRMIVVTACVRRPIQRRQKAKILTKKRPIKKESTLKKLDINEAVLLCEL